LCFWLCVAAANGETFSFAVVADPHIGGSADHYSKLNTAVDWIISNKDSRDIELVFVVGDIAWGGPRSRRNLRQAKEMLDRLAGAGIAYLPVIGDNEIQARENSRRLSTGSIAVCRRFCRTGEKRRCP